VSAALRIGRVKRPVAGPEMRRNPSDQRPAANINEIGDVSASPAAGPDKERKPTTFRPAAKLPAEKPARRKATRATKPKDEAPSVETLRQGASHLSSPRCESPSDETHAAEKPQRDRATIRPAFSVFPPGLALTSASIVTRLAQLQKFRKFCIKSQSRNDRSIESLIAGALGYRIDQTDKERRKAFAQAKDHRLSIEGKKTAKKSEGLEDLEMFILHSASCRVGWDAMRARYEIEMRKLAKMLPVWPFVQEIRGLDALGLAVIAGEARIPLGDYRSKEGLWKRMGLAVIEGERQRRHKNPEKAALHGYCPSRRAEIWAFCSDTMFRAQWRGDRDEDGNLPKESGKPVAVPAHPLGRYGEIYARRREHTALRVIATSNLPFDDPGKWTPARCKNDALRIMTKALMEDLRREWRRAEGVAD